MIQSARSLKPSSQDEAPEIDFSQLQMNTLRRYKKHFKVVTKPNLNKPQMAEVIDMLYKIIYIYLIDNISHVMVYIHTLNSKTY